MIIGEESLNEILYRHPNEIILLIFSASWCGPCKRLKEKLKDDSDTIVSQLKDLKYLIIDVDEDENNELCKRYQVSSIPYQVFITLIPDETGNLTVKVLDKILGYDLVGLLSKYQKLTSE
jgi:thiol:disulfide interchange protein